ncbi:hypothetical protein [Vibrio paucivorans]
MIKQQSLVNTIHLAVTFTIAVGVLYLYTWPYAFFFPLLCLHIRYNELTELSVKQYASLFVVAVGGIALGLAISTLYSTSTLLFVLATALVLFLLYWWERYSHNQLHTALGVLSFALVCAVTFANHLIVADFSYYLFTNLLFAMSLCFALDKALSYVMLRLTSNKAQYTSNTQVSSTPQLFSNEWQAIAIFLPAAFAFILFDLSHYYVVLIAICVLTLTPNLAIIRQDSLRYVYANLIGGGLAVLGYYSYALISLKFGPSVAIELCLTFMFTLILGVIIYCSNWKPLGKFMLSPYAILLIQSDNVGFSILDSFQLRLVSVGIAIVYLYGVIHLITSTRVSIK